MTQIRREPVIGRWVIVENDVDSLGPQDYEVTPVRYHQDAICQFCPGREAQTPPEVDAVRDQGAANTPGWRARVVPNKFPALRIEGELNKRGVGIYDRTNGVGAHEVVIESPGHRHNLADLGIGAIDDVFSLYQRRSISLAKDKRFKYIIVFRNYGEPAGASVEHGHSQIIALPMIPKFVQEELEGADTFHRSHGRCVYCEMITQEKSDGARLITESENFLAFCPFAPRYPFENWIIPKDHDSHFIMMSDHVRRDLAGIMKDVLSRMKEVLRDPPYNYYLHVRPIGYEGTYHWHIEIIPSLTREAGFEWGTGFYVVRTSPTMAARHLRDAAVAAVG